MSTTVATAFTSRAMPGRLRSSRSRWWRGIAASVAPLALFACVDTEPSPFVQHADNVYWALELNHHAVLLATTGSAATLALTATPRDHAGEPLSELGIPQFISPDIEHVTVTPEGVLFAVAPTPENTEVAVRARLTVNGITHEDTVYVRVMDPPDPLPVLDTFTIHAAGDSGKIASGLDWTLPLHATDTHGAPIPNLPVFFRSSDNLVATVNRATGTVQTSGGSKHPGAVTFYASSTVFGVVKADTLHYRFGVPLFALISLDSVTTPGLARVNLFSPSDVTIATGGVVNFILPIPELDISFADTQLPYVADLSIATWASTYLFPGFPIELVCGFYNCVAGNIVPPNTATAFVRVFTAPGIYEYHSNFWGATGRIVVVDDP